MIIVSLIILRVLQLAIFVAFFFRYQLVTMFFAWIVVLAGIALLTQPELNGVHAIEGYSFDGHLEEALALAKTRLVKEKSQALIIADDGARLSSEDKYLVTEQLACSTLNALVRNLMAFGLTMSDLKTIKEWASNSLIMLRFQAEERWELVREETKEETSRTAHQRTYTEFMHDVTISHRLDVIRSATQVSSAANSSLTVWNSQRSFSYVSRSRQHGIGFENRDENVDITWLIDALSPALFNGTADALLVASFRIDRESDDTWTPARDPQVQSIRNAAMKFREWTLLVHCTEQRWLDDSTVFRVDQAVEKVFVPVAALFEKVDGQTDDLTVMSPDTVSLLLEEESASLREALESVDTFPHATGPNGQTAFFTRTELRIEVVLVHMMAVLDTFQQCIDYVEAIVRRPLVAALGKAATVADLPQ